MRIKLSRTQWEQAGKTSGWLKNATNGARTEPTLATGQSNGIIKAAGKRTQLIQAILSHPFRVILDAIRSIGKMTPDSLIDILNMCEPHELGEILETINKANIEPQTAVDRSRPPNPR